MSSWGRAGRPKGHPYRIHPWADTLAMLAGLSAGLIVGHLIYWVFL